MSGLRGGDDPTSPLKFGCEVSVGELLKRFLRGRKSGSLLDGSKAVFLDFGSLLEFRDVFVGLVASELASGLTLREVHLVAGLFEALEASIHHQVEELLELFMRGGRSRSLSKGHALSLALRQTGDGDLTLPDFES